MRAGLRELIQSLYRRPQEIERLKSESVVRLRWVLFGAVALLLAVPLAAALVVNVGRWLSYAAEVPMQPAQWHALYETAREPCDAAAPVSRGCPANPGNPLLWQSPFVRDDQDAHFERVKALDGREYWIGATITAAQAREAYERQANFVEIGLLRGLYRVWVEGEQVMSGHWTDNEPIAVQLPLPMLARGQPIHVAVALRRNTDVNDAPDALERPPRLGLTTKAGVSACRMYQNFWGTTRPLIFLAMNLLLAVIFFSVWAVAPEKSEYFYISIMAMTFALFQLRYTELYYLTLNRGVVNLVALEMAVLYGFAGAFAGFAFARLRAGLFRPFQVACLLLCIVMPLLYGRDTIRQQVVAHFWMTSMADAGNLLGAAACLLQACYLRSNVEERARLRRRIRRLILFSLALCTLVALNHVAFAEGSVSLVKVLLGKSGPFFLLVSLALVALSEYRAEHELAESMPVSRFHRLDPLPDFVEGVLLNVDIKGSERMARMSAKLRRTSDFVEMCLSHLWAAVSQCGGTVIRTEGDAILALFPREGAGGDPLPAAFRAVAAMREGLAQLEVRFLSQGYSAALPEKGLHFRAALVEGRIRPIWQAYGGARLANWTEAGDSNALVESARLLELERQVSGGDPATCLVLPAALRARIEGDGGARWLFRSREIVGKHGRAYDVAACRF